MDSDEALARILQQEEWGHAKAPSMGSVHAVSGGPSVAPGLDAFTSLPAISARDTALPSHIVSTAVDSSLELTDPTPDVHELFLYYNSKYFDGRLVAVVVKWSKRMTLYVRCQLLSALVYSLCDPLC